MGSNIIGPGSGKTCPRCNRNTYWGHSPHCDYEQWKKQQEDEHALRLGDAFIEAVRAGDALNVGRILKGQYRAE